MSVIVNPIIDLVASLDLRMRINSEDNKCNGCLLASLMIISYQFFLVTRWKTTYFLVLL